MAFANTEMNKNIDQLNSFLRGEISAVESYRIAIEKLDPGSTSLTDLYACMKSHEQRVDKLQAKIRSLGGVPEETSGAWGTMVRAIEKSAAVLGDKVAISALEEGEDHGLSDYKSDLDKLDPEARSLVASELLPLQEETHRMLSTLKRQRATA